MPAAPICPRVQSLKATERALKSDLSDALAERDGRNENLIVRLQRELSETQSSLRAARKAERAA